MTKKYLVVVIDAEYPEIEYERFILNAPADTNEKDLKSFGREKLNKSREESGELGFEEWELLINVYDLSEFEELNFTGSEDK